MGSVYCRKDKIYGGYLIRYKIQITENTRYISITIIDDPTNGVVAQPPSVGDRFSFNLDGIKVDAPVVSVRRGATRTINGNVQIDLPTDTATTSTIPIGAGFVRPHTVWGIVAELNGVQNINTTYIDPILNRGIVRIEQTFTVSFDRGGWVFTRPTVEASTSYDIITWIYNYNPNKSLIIPPNNYLWTGLSNQQGWNPVQIVNRPEQVVGILDSLNITVVFGNAALIDNYNWVTTPVKFNQLAFDIINGSTGGTTGGGTVIGGITTGGGTTGGGTTGGGGVAGKNTIVGDTVGNTSNTFTTASVSTPASAKRTEGAGAEVISSQATAKQTTQGSFSIDPELGFGTYTDPVEPTLVETQIIGRGRIGGIPGETPRSNISTVNKAGNSDFPDKPIEFLGCYAVDVQLNASFKGNNSTCNMTLVEDDDQDNPKKFIFTNTIEGYESPDLGTACVFKIKDFALFAGPIQRYKYEESVSGGRKYTVDLESPASMMDGVYVVLGGWDGTIWTNDGSGSGDKKNKKQDKLDADAILQPDLKPILTYNNSTIVDAVKAVGDKLTMSKESKLTPTNIINLFGYKENHRHGGGLKDPKRPSLGTVGGKFGAADRNSMGYPVKDIVKDLKACCDAGVFGGLIKFGGTEYELDLTELEKATSIVGDFRIPDSPVIGLNSLIEKICEVAMFDYYIYVEEDKKYPCDDYGVLKRAFLKIKLISRKEPPDPNQISKIIKGLQELPDDAKTLVSFDLGKELTGDLITQTVLMGAPVTRTWFPGQFHMLPIWGQKGSGKNAIYYVGRDMWDYTNPFAYVKLTLPAYEMGSLDTNAPLNPDDFVEIETNMLELRCAMSGRNIWYLYHKMFQVLAEEQRLLLNYFGAVQLTSPYGNFTQEDIKDIWNGGKNTHDFFDTSIDSAEIYASYMFGMKDAQKDRMQRALNTRFNVIAKAAEKFYGKQFMIAIPSEPKEVDDNFRWIEFDKEPAYLWDMVQSGWAFNNVTDYINDIAFYEGGAGRLKASVFYPAYNYEFPEYGYKVDTVLVDYTHVSDPGPWAIYKTIYTDPRDLLEKERDLIVTPQVNIDKEWGVKFFDIRDPSLELVKGPIANGRDIKDSTGKKVGTNYVFGFIKVDVPPVPYYDYYTTETNAFGVLAQLICGDVTGIGKDIKVTYANMFGSENLEGEAGIAPAMMPPYMLSIPQQSTSRVWGPWWSFSGWDKVGADGKSTDKSGKDGRKGKASITTRDDFAPESFGDIKKMNLAAQAYCDATLEKQHTVETGNVTLAEAPKWRLNDRIFDPEAGPYISAMTIGISVEGITTHYAFTNWTQRANKLAMYNYERMIKSQANSFKYQSLLRSLKHQAKTPAINRKLLASFEKQAAINTVNKSSNNGIFGNLMNVLANAINGPVYQAEVAKYEKAKVQYNTDISRPRLQNAQPLVAPTPPDAKLAPKDIGVNIHSSPTQAAMKAVGFNAQESFGASFEQIYSPAYIFDQRFPENHRISFNEGLTKGYNKGYAYDPKTTWDDKTRHENKNLTLPPKDQPPNGY